MIFGALGRPWQSAAGRRADPGPVWAPVPRVVKIVVTDRCLRRFLLADLQSVYLHVCQRRCALANTGRGSSFHTRLITATRWVRPRIVCIAGSVGLVPTSVGRVWFFSRCVLEGDQFLGDVNEFDVRLLREIAQKFEGGHRIEAEAFHEGFPCPGRLCRGWLRRSGTVVRGAWSSRPWWCARRRLIPFR
jgi:hypothetical protein